MSVGAKQAISIVHSLAAAEVWYEKRINSPRGSKSAERAMIAARLDAFCALTGRDPDAAERERLLYGDA